ncbi:MAG TPA: ATP-binding cassette domain-containing protein [Pseudonocardiaceae bacterium]|nr:ATP-binding cassette domain-containing protein [Pseudonocardiaceae bacterium]
MITATGKNLVRFDAVRKVYGTARHDRAALSDITFGMPRGTCAVVTGDAGSGKSTLLRLAAGLTAPTAGTVTLAGTAVGGLGRAAAGDLRRARIGYLTAEPGLVPGCSVLDNIMLPLGHSADRRQADSLMDQLGLTRVAHRVPAALSVRLRRRVALARALVIDPVLVVADEPTGGDPVALGSLVRWLRVRGHCLLIGTRDARPVSRWADQLLQLRTGRLDMSDFLE